jgi:hypothetical protein
MAVSADQRGSLLGVPQRCGYSIANNGVGFRSGLPIMTQFVPHTSSNVRQRKVSWQRRKARWSTISRNLGNLRHWRARMSWEPSPAARCAFTVEPGATYPMLLKPGRMEISQIHSM